MNPNKPTFTTNDYEAVHRYVDGRSDRIDSKLRHADSAASIARVANLGKWFAIGVVATGFAVFLILWGISLLKDKPEPRIIKTEKVVIQRVPLNVTIQKDGTVLGQTSNRSPSSQPLNIPSSIGSTEDRLMARGRSMGKFNIALKWNTIDDLDLSVKEPNGKIISFREKRSVLSKGFLDIDENAGSRRNATPIENIKWNRLFPIEGQTEIWVTGYQRNTGSNMPVKFEVEVSKEGNVIKRFKNEISFNGPQQKLKIWEFNKNFRE